MINESEYVGRIWWQVCWTGLRGGVIKILIYRERISFVKKYTFADDESFNIAKRIMRDRVAQILHLKNDKNSKLSQLAQYAIDAKEIIETDDILL